MKIIVTAGPTREPIDAVRFLSNRSSGKMGYALARAAHRAGHEVTLISGPVALNPPEGVRLIPVTTSDEMADAVQTHLPGVDLVVLAAAVADFKPATVSLRKLKKRDGIPTIALVPTRDILATLGAMERRSFRLVGFAAETDDLAENATRKLREKRCDLIIANDVSVPGIGFEGDDNALTLFFADGRSLSLPRATKEALAKEIVSEFPTLPRPGERQ